MFDRWVALRVRVRVRPVSILWAGILWATFSAGATMLYADGPLIVGHRGASHDAPENSLAAFQLAFAQNADGVEGDFYLTSDDEIVCIHDKDTERTAGMKLVVEKSTLMQLQDLDVGRWKDAKFAGEKIPSFAEVLKTVPAGKRFIIELKSGPEIVPVLKRKLDSLDHSAIELMIIAFNAETVGDCKEQMPDVRVHWLTAFDKPGPGQDFRPTVAEIAQVVRQCNADGVGFHGNTGHVDASWISRLKGNGVDEFHVWTIDDPDRAKEYADWGAFGITTNRPAFIRDAIAR